MNRIFDSINQFFSHLAPITNIIWDFPTNFAWYSHIPILGYFSLPIFVLVGVGVYFSIRTGFIQTTSFRKIIKLMLRKQSSSTGVSAWASFMLGLAMRVGPGNIVGITGAISIGGPGALFWMWVSAFFGMSTAFVEAVLAQLFKEKKNDEFVGGLPFYGQRLLGNRRYVGIILSCVYIVYALFNIPAQTFNVFTAVGAVANTVVGHDLARSSLFYYVIAVILVVACVFIILGGIRRVIRYVDYLVPIKAILFCGISVIVVVANFPLIPYFFHEVIVGAFSPHALFGGTIGVALAQGVKRGLMSNEAGQGTITMAAAVANNDHPCEQGLVQSFGVFCDTMVICTLTGFIVVMAHVWTGTTSSTQWAGMADNKLLLYLTSLQSLVTPMFIWLVKIVMGICYGLFAFTTLLGMISFAEISANFISRSKGFIYFIRIMGSLVFVPFGILTVLAGLELGNLWSISDLMNIIMVYINVPLILIGAPLVYRVLDDYRTHKGGHFISSRLGIKTEYWVESRK